MRIAPAVRCPRPNWEPKLYTRRAIVPNSDFSDGTATTTTSSSDISIGGHGPDPNGKRRRPLTLQDVVEAETQRRERRRQKRNGSPRYGFAAREVCFFVGHDGELGLREYDWFSREWTVLSSTSPPAITCRIPVLPPAPTQTPAQTTTLTPGLWQPPSRALGSIQSISWAGTPVFVPTPAPAPQGSVPLYPPLAPVQTQALALGGSTLGKKRTNPLKRGPPSSSPRNGTSIVGGEPEPEDEEYGEELYLPGESSSAAGPAANSARHRHEGGKARAGRARRGSYQALPELPNSSVARPTAGTGTGNDNYGSAGSIPESSSAPTIFGASTDSGNRGRHQISSATVVGDDMDVTMTEAAAAARLDSVVGGRGQPSKVRVKGVVVRRESTGGIKRR